MLKKQARKIIDLENELERIRNEFMKCETCPKNCCNFHEGFILELSENAAQNAYKEPAIKQMMREKRLKRTDTGYQLINGPCPMLKNNRCSIHDKKEEFGLERCMKFPLYPTNYTYDSIIADLRCFEFKLNQNGLLEKLALIKEKFKVSIYIKYIDEKIVKKTTLEEYMKKENKIY